MNMDIDDEIFDDDGQKSDKDRNLMAKGYKKGNLIHLSQGEFKELYENNFFGNLEDNELILIPEEASLLIERSRIKIYFDKDFREEVNLGKFIELISKHDEDFWSKYLVYKDLRSRGYVVRSGYGGSGKLVPYRRYPRGAKPDTKQSDTFIYPFSEGMTIEPHQFDLIVNQAQSNRKSLLLGIIDRSGDVTYYKASEFQIPVNTEKFEWKNED